MANSTGGVAPWLMFLVGGLVVAVVVLGFLVYNGSLGGAAPATRTVVVHDQAPAPAPHWMHRHARNGDDHHGNNHPHDNHPH